MKVRVGKKSAALRGPGVPRISVEVGKTGRRHLTGKHSNSRKVLPAGASRLLGNAQQAKNVKKYLLPYG